MSRPGQALTDALLKMADAGQRPRCGDWNDNNPWVSEDSRLRAMAARWCAGCPVLDECAEAGQAMKATFGVWGGRDRTRREPGTRAQPVVGAGLCEVLGINRNFVEAAERNH